MFRYKLRTLLILMAVGPPVLAGAWIVGQLVAGEINRGVMPNVLELSRDLVVPMLAAFALVIMLIQTIRIRSVTAVGTVLQYVSILGLFLMTLTALSFIAITLMVHVTHSPPEVRVYRTPAGYGRLAP